MKLPYQEDKLVNEMPLVALKKEKSDSTEPKNKIK